MKKKFVIKSVLVMLPFAVVFLAMELALRNIPDDYTYKSAYLDKNAGQIETLILGASAEYYGLNPEYFDSKTFNASHVSQGYSYDSWILKKYESQMTHLKTVIIPVSYAILYFDMDDSKEAWRIKNYVLYYHYPSPSLEYYSELLTQKASINLKRLYTFYIKRQGGLTSSELGWGNNYLSTITQDLTKTAEEALERHTGMNEEIRQRNIVLLGSMIEDCRKKSVNVLLLNAPVSEVYRKGLENNQLNEVRKTAGELAGQYDNCVYLDMLDDSRFTTADFYDADHLNEKGAKKLSQMVNFFIDSTFNASNH